MNFDQIEQHYKEHRNTYVKRISRRAGTPEAAEDIIQEAYCRALKYSYSFIGGDLDKWISTIIGNALRDYMNGERGYIPVEPSEDDELAPEVLYPRRVMKEVFGRIALMSADQQEILNLFFIQEYTAKDISCITPHSQNKCDKVIQKFRKELRKDYE
jgi:RNA polymerase sigma factor (sigma-70 family)